MQNEVQFAGFGGQGIMVIGQLLAHCGMNEGKEVCWLPSYGPEMRGGTAYCTVVLSSRAIGSPVIGNPRYLVAMNRPSLEKFAPNVKAGGGIIINSSLVPVTTPRTDLRVVRVPCNELALEVGDNRTASMVALGALLGLQGLVELETMKRVLTEFFESKRKGKVVPVNHRALERGYELGAAATEIPVEGSQVRA